MKRYEHCKVLNRMISAPDGEWVKYEDVKKLKELNREMYVLIRFIEMDIDDIIKRKVEVDWKSRKNRIAEVLAKAGGEGE